jgi:hypothetical protein
MSVGGQRGAMIVVFLVDGTPEGPRVIDWKTGKESVLAFSRADYSNVRRRSELSQTGVYVLMGPDPAGIKAQMIYIGEGENLKARLDSHQREKEFWTQGFVFTMKDGSLTKTQARYLETRLIGIATKAENASLDNGTAPEPEMLGEAEEAEVETYLDNALRLFPIAGIDTFELAEAASSPAPQAGDESDSAGEVHGFSRLHLDVEAATAEGEDRPQGFLVFKGALGRKEARTMVPTYEALRNALINEGALVETPDGESLELTRNYIFDSPSAAASVLVAGSRSGRQVWKDARGKTLADIQAEVASDELGDPGQPPDGEEPTDD